MLGIEHLVRHAALFEHPRDHFAALDGDRADKDRPARPLDAANLAAGNRLLLTGLAVLELDRVVRLAEDLAQQLVAFFRDDDVPLVHPLDFLGDGLVLLPLAAVDHVRMVHPLHLAIGGHRDHVELVDLPELVGLGHGGAGHAADLLVELEEVLQRDRGQGLVFFLDADAFLGLDRLVQAVAPIAAGHETAGELVDDDHLAFLVDDVVHVALVKVVGLQAVVDQVRPLHVPGRVEALDAGQLLGGANAVVGEVGRVLLLVDLEVRALLQLPRDAIGLGVAGHVVVGRTGNNQRRAGFVDEDVVDLVDDREVQRPLHLLPVLVEAVVVAGRVPHVVAEIVEAELVVRAVGDVAGVGLLPVGRVHLALDRVDRQAERHVERTHPFHVAAGQVVVHRDDVYALAFQGIEVSRQRGHQRLAFAGDHFRDVAAVQDDAAHQLHVVVPHAQVAAAGLAADGKGLDQQIVERLPGGQTLAKLGRLLLQLGIGHRLVLRLQGPDGVDHRLHLLDVPGVRRTEQARQRSLDPAAHSAEDIP